MDKWTVIVEIGGVVVWQQTYACIGAAQMEQESRRLHYYYHRGVDVWIRQS